LKAERGLVLDVGLVDHHVGDVAPNWVDAVASRALKALRVFTVLKRFLADGTNQKFQQVFSNHRSKFYAEKRIKSFNAMVHAMFFLSLGNDRSRSLPKDDFH
jgi:hypothetical protein